MTDCDLLETTSRSVRSHFSRVTQVISLFALLFVSPIVLGKESTELQFPRHIQYTIDAIERRVEQLKTEGRNDEATEISNQLAKILAFVRGESASPPDVSGNEVEVHVAGVYEGRDERNQTATVRITYTDKPIILALCAYEPVWWTIDVAPGVKIKKIILGGRRHQEVEKGHPDGVPLEKHLAELEDRDAFYAHEVDDDHYPKAMATLKRLTGIVPSSFVGTERAGDEPLVIGPENPAWRALKSEAYFQQLYEAATAEIREKLEGQLADFAFPGVFHDGVAMGPFLHSASVGTLKVSGPVAQSLKHLEVGVTQIAKVPGTTTAYGVSKNKLYEIDLESGEFSIKKLAYRKDLPQFGTLTGVTFDTKRQRLLVVSNSPVARVYAYDLERDYWSLMTLPNNISVCGAIAYHPIEDAFYVTGYDFSKPNLPTPRRILNWSLYRFDSDGKQTGSTDIVPPIALVQHHAFQIQLTWFQEDLFVIIPQRIGLIPRRENDDTAVSTAYIVNGKSGEVVYSTPHGM